MAKEIVYANNYKTCVDNYTSSRLPNRSNFVTNTLMPDKRRWTEAGGKKIDALFKEFHRGDLLQVLVNRIASTTSLGYSTEFILQYFEDGNGFPKDVDSEGIRRSLLRIAAIRDVADIKGDLIDSRMSKGTDIYNRSMADIQHLNAFEESLAQEVSPSMGESTGSTSI